MQCPRCGRMMPPESIACAYCGTRLPSAAQASGSGRITCAICGKFMLMRGKFQNKTMCIECEQKHLQQLAQERYREERLRQARVNDIIARHPEIKPMVTKRLGLQDLEGPFVVEMGAYRDIIAWDEKITHARNLELAKRYEDAAKHYEELGLWKEAGAVREKKSARTVKHITVNLNDLIEKLRTGGLSVPYKCGSCGASITIDKNTSADGLKFCSYCGSAINTDTLADFLRDALK